MADEIFGIRRALRLSLIISLSWSMEFSKRPRLSQLRLQRTQSYFIFRELNHTSSSENLLAHQSLGFKSSSHLGVDVLILMVTNEGPAYNILFGDVGSVAVSHPLSPRDLWQPWKNGYKIMVAGVDEALKSTGYVLSALSEKLYIIKGGCGAENWD